MYNFIDFKELTQSNSIIENGDITGCSGGAIPGFNMDDTAPIGDNDIEWFCNSSSANPNSISSANDWTSGLSHPIAMHQGRRYLFKYTLSEIFSNNCDIYFLLINNSGYAIARIEPINNISSKKFTFQYVPNAFYSKIMIVANNVGGGSFSPSVSDVNIYELDNNQLSSYALPLVNGDVIKAYTNFEIDNSVYAFANLKLGLYSDRFYLYNIATLNQIVVSGNIYNVYFEWTVPALPKDNFRFVLYEDTENIRYISNSFTSKIIQEYTSVVKYRNTINAFNFLYESVPSFYNQFRIDLWKGRPSFQQNTKGYETYLGDFIETKSDTQKSREFETRFFNEIAHDAFSCMLLHDEIYIDEVQYKRSQRSNYEITWSDDDDNIIGNGSVSLIETDYSASIQSC